MHAEALDEQDDGAVAPAPPHEVHLPAEPERARPGSPGRPEPELFQPLTPSASMAAYPDARAAMAAASSGDAPWSRRSSATAASRGSPRAEERELAAWAVVATERRSGSRRPRWRGGRGVFPACALGAWETRG